MMYAIRGDERVLLLRLGAMGDILHALPAVEVLRRSFPGLTIDWLVKPQWMPLLTGNPHISNLLPYQRSSLKAVMGVARTLRAARYDLVIDLQGLLQSGLLAVLSGATHRVGYSARAAREGLAARCYQSTVEPTANHIADRHLEVVRSLGAQQPSAVCWLPPGMPEGTLPGDPFVLASPLAGWPGKQWPLERFGELGERLSQESGVSLVLNVAEAQRERIAGIPGVRIHCSSIAGLIDATRRALAVVGLDSGPLHLAGALGKPGIALFGPTDPARNGPYPLDGAMRVLRTDGAVTTYKREQAISASMRALSVDSVYHSLRQVIAEAGHQSPDLTGRRS